LIYGDLTIKNTSSVAPVTETAIKLIINRQAKTPAEYGLFQSLESIIDWPLIARRKKQIISARQ